MYLVIFYLFIYLFIYLLMVAGGREGPKLLKLLKLY